MNTPAPARDRARDRSRFEVLKMKVKRDLLEGSSANVAKTLNRKLKKTQTLVYLKHNTLVGNWAYWTAIIENAEVAR